MIGMSDKKMYLIMLCIVSAIFFGFCIYGYMSSIAEPSAGDASAESFQQIASELETQAPGLLTGQIFFNNLKVCLILFIGGITFGAATIFILSSNGYIIGSISEVMLRTFDVKIYAATLIPHGIFEISAILMSAALGLQLATSLILDATGYSNAGNTCVWYGTRFLLIVVPLLIIAALVESFISPLAAEWVMAGFLR